jgi:hypothetical protein
MRKEDKYMPVIDCGGPWDFETSRLPHFVENRLKDGCEVVSLTRWLPFTTPPPRESCWYSLLLEAESTPGP